MGIILIIALLLSAGVSYSAESSLPGDMLYSVKTGVNERVSGWVAMSGEAESEHQANLAIRRLDEAEKLEAEGRLDIGLKSELESEFREHVKAADDEIDNLKEDGNSDAASSVKTKIKSSVSAKGSILGITEIEIENEFESEGDIEIDDDDDFIDEDDGENSDQGSVETNIKSEINGDFGNLKLAYESGILRLTGKLNRANPCVEWKVKTSTAEGSSTSSVWIDITKTSTADVCIQVLGQPQEIDVKVPNVGENAIITVKVEGRVVYYAKLG